MGRTIAIIGGTGKEGRGIALRWANAGHEVIVGSRDGQRAAEKAAELSSLGHGTIRGSDNASAVRAAEVALLSVPYGAHGDTLRGLRQELQDRVLIDITVPLAPPKVRTVHLPKGRAAALEAQEVLGPGAKVVAALHHVSSAHLADPEHAIDCDVLACSDDPAALELALSLIGDLGLSGYDAGPLANAVALESLTPVLLHLNKRYKGRGAGLRLTGI
ncbi:MAG: NADPH-dependent F420 reductase [Myxococcales bacterium]|nr:NADPH-dependent F420 reductase [Myxococcales bacterium]